MWVPCNLELHDDALLYSQDTSSVPSLALCLASHSATGSLLHQLAVCLSGPLCSDTVKVCQHSIQHQGHTHPLSLDCHPQPICCCLMRMSGPLMPVQQHLRLRKESSYQSSVCAAGRHKASLWRKAQRQALQQHVRGRLDRRRVYRRGWAWGWWRRWRWRRVCRRVVW